MESGELTKLQNKWWHEQAKCTAANKKSHPEFYPNDGLALNNLAGIFFVLIVGLILSLFVAIIEFCFKQHDPMKQHQKFKTKPSATGTAMNTLQGKPKLTIQEQRDFDNGRVTVSMQTWRWSVALLIYSLWYQRFRFGNLKFQKEEEEEKSIQLNGWKQKMKRITFAGKSATPNRTVAMNTALFSFNHSFRRCTYTGNFFQAHFSVQVLVPLLKTSQ